MTELYQVYIRKDERDAILEIQSSTFLTETEGWIQIDEGAGDQYHHAQRHYLPDSLFTMDGFPRYRWTDDSIVERTEEELEADRLPIRKEQKIQKRKADLEAYLLSHTLQWTDGETYSITEEKQNQLMGTLMAAQLDGKKPEWNTSGGVCREWELAELTGLAVAIKDRVKALVKYQQTKEVMMNKAKTLEELNSIIVNYDEVK